MAVLVSRNTHSIRKVCANWKQMLNLFISKLRTHICVLCFYKTNDTYHLQVHHICRLLSIWTMAASTVFLFCCCCCWLLLLLLNSPSIVHTTRDKQITNQNQMACIAHNFLLASFSLFPTHHLILTRWLYNASNLQPTNSLFRKP